jgi:hypothetical protein
LRKLSSAEEEEIASAGEVSRMSVSWFRFGTNALFGAVSLEVVDVTHRGSPPFPTSRCEVHPLGRAGAATPSKFCDSAVASTPTERSKAAVPRSCPPSSRTSVALRVPPQESPGSATNVKFLSTAAPGAIAP